jgi:hypothetical protein
MRATAAAAAFALAAERRKVLHADRHTLVHTQRDTKRCREVSRCWRSASAASLAQLSNLTKTLLFDVVFFSRNAPRAHNATVGCRVRTSRAAGPSAPPKGELLAAAGPAGRCACQRRARRARARRKGRPSRPGLERVQRAQWRRPLGRKWGSLCANPVEVAAAAAAATGAGELGAPRAAAPSRRPPAQDSLCEGQAGAGLRRARSLGRSTGRRREGPD